MDKMDTRDDDRPITKFIRTIDVVTTNAIRREDLFTAEWPGTVVGLRWALEVTTGGDEDKVVWAIVVAHLDPPEDNISFTNDDNLYTPSANCIAWGQCHLFSIASLAKNAWRKFEGTTSIKRKLRVGDKLQLVYLADEATNNQLFGAVQFFIES